MIYRTVDVIKYYLTCIKCRKQRTLKRSAKLEYLLNKGIRKLNNDLDIVNALETIRHSRILVNLSLTKEDQLLMKSQRQDVIDSSDSDAEAKLWESKWSRSKSISAVNDRKAQAFLLRQALGKYQDVQVTEAQRGILQGILTESANMKELLGHD